MNYYIEVNINIESMKYESNVTMELATQESSKLEFIVQNGMIIDSVMINKQKVEWNLEDVEHGFIENAKKLSLEYKGQNEDLIIEYKIRGGIPEIEDQLNQRTDNYIELNLYSAWYPVLMEFMPFNTHIIITGLNDYYILKGMRIGQKWELKLSNVYDNCIIGYRNYTLEMVEFNNKHVRIISPKKFIGNMYIFDTVKSVLEHCKTSFERSIDESFDIAIADRRSGTGYCRKNLIVMNQDLEDIKYYEMFLAHEISHFWFKDAEINTWEDWLNESFAEYFSLLYMKGKHGEEFYNRRIEKLRAYTKDCPCIYNSDRNSEQGSRIRYKGTVLFHELQEKFGEGSFYKVANELVSLEERNTKALIESIRKKDMIMGDFIESRVFSK